MIITDLDGTLYNDAQTISKKDYNTLLRLEKKNIPRIIATGRSLYSALKVIPVNFPVDYLIFSSGAGIMEWKSKKIINEFSLDAGQIKTSADIFMTKKLDFMLHRKIPDNHYFYYHETDNPCSDFIKRCELYKRFAEKLDPDFIHKIDCACQFIIIKSWKEQEWFYEISSLLDSMKVIRTTSPIDKKSLWIEVFPFGVSKAMAAELVAEIVKSNWENTAAIGNDYNDLDMLCWAAKSYVVDNAPDELKDRFINVRSNNDSGFSEAVEKWEKAGLDPVYT